MAGSKQSECGTDRFVEATLNASFACKLTLEEVGLRIGGKPGDARVSHPLREPIISVSAES